MKFFVVFAALIAAAAAAGWGYGEDNGPDTWAEKYDATCGLKSQSPIDIQEADTVYKKFEMALSGYSTPIEWSANNNGHTITLSVPAGNAGTYMVDAIDAYNTAENTWQLLQFHLHWDMTNTLGSENRLNGIAYPLEMHLVHGNTKYDPSDITNHADGALVLGFFFEIGGENPAFDKVTQLVPLLRNKGNVTTSASLAPNALIAGSVEKGEFFSWAGSLTTPGCAEAVSWYMFKKPIKISQNQMDQLRGTLYENEVGETEHVMEKNWRPPQPLNDRMVFKSWEKKPDPTPAPPPTCGAGAFTFSIFTVIASVLFTTFH